MAKLNNEQLKQYSDVVVKELLNHTKYKPLLEELNRTTILDLHGVVLGFCCKWGHDPSNAKQIADHMRNEGMLEMEEKIDAPV